MIFSDCWHIWRSYKVILNIFFINLSLILFYIRVFLVFFLELLKFPFTNAFLKCFWLFTEAGFDQIYSNNMVLFYWSNVLAHTCLLNWNDIYFVLFWLLYFLDFFHCVSNFNLVVGRLFYFFKNNFLCLIIFIYFISFFNDFELFFYWFFPLYFLDNFIVIIIICWWRHFLVFFFIIWLFRSMIFFFWLIVLVDLFSCICLLLHFVILVPC